MLESFLTIEVLLYVLIAFAALILILLAWAAILHVRLHRLSRGVSGKNLEEAVASILADYHSFDEYQKELETVLRHFDARLRSSARGVATVRFDAFAGNGSGGMQSFATALISERGDGVVISSMHAREHTRVFAKPITNFTSEFELTAEEQKAVAEARARTKA
jgi:hypothetical protein